MLIEHKYCFDTPLFLLLSNVFPNEESATSFILQKVHPTGNFG